ncbi:MAG TPA: HAMP domain-containing sensor histidine kinase [Solirubrobacterales bacterium]|nr:HAMP domain-containing sensor histidine kinase [Solirubrobacterales bacterium]
MTSLFGSVRSQLVVLFSIITAAAIGFIYLYVVPQLSSSLSAEKLRALGDSSEEPAEALSEVIGEGLPQEELQQVVLRLSQRSGGRLTVLGVREGDTGPEPAFVVADSQVERTALEPSYPAATTALESGETATAVERVGGERLGETASPISLDDEIRWISVVSQSLSDVDDNVSLITRQILIAGLIALGAAIVAGSLAARAHSGRLRRLEAAAEKVAHGDFSTPIPIDSDDEVGQLAAVLEEMRERLARLDNARKEFIANASHELRTPIFSLGGFVELLDEDEPDPVVRAEFVATMREQIQRLTKLTTALLDLSKLDADALQVRAQPIDLAELANVVAAEFGPAAESHSSRLDVHDSGTVEALGDPERVLQIIRILIDNALSHTPEKTRITVTAKLQQGEPTLTVADNGPGISKSASSQVFERFYTGDEVSGSGLGLSIARDLARVMGGRLDLSARPGHTEFTLRLPAADRVPA